jgi:hypothetical protein
VKLPASGARDSLIGSLRGTSVFRPALNALAGGWTRI